MPVAQLVEHLTFNQRAQDSSSCRRTKIAACYRYFYSVTRGFFVCIPATDYIMTTHPHTMQCSTARPCRVWRAAAYGQAAGRTCAAPTWQQWFFRNISANSRSPSGLAPRGQLPTSWGAFFRTALPSAKASPYRGGGRACEAGGAPPAKKGMYDLSNRTCLFILYSFPQQEQHGQQHT